MDASPRRIESMKDRRPFAGRLPTLLAWAAHAAVAAVPAMGGLQAQSSPAPIAVEAPADTLAITAAGPGVELDATPVGGHGSQTLPALELPPFYYDDDSEVEEMTSAATTVAPLAATTKVDPVLIPDSSAATIGGVALLLLAPVIFNRRLRRRLLLL